MKYEFANGTTQQQERWAEAVHHLLHLPAEDISLVIATSFVDPSTLTGHGHTDLALTTYTYGSLSAKTEIRSDAPSFGEQFAVLKAYAASLGLSFSIERFYMETAIHELGHALFSALPEARRVAIAEMFGANTDDPAVINSSSKPWQDRVAEGIAETFKEAFLPRRYRVFPNRTNLHLPYHEYPAFRSLWREAVPEASGSGRVEEDLLAGFTTDLNNPLNSRTWESRVVAKTKKILVPQNFSYSMTVPRSLFPAKAEGKPAGTIYGYIQFALRVKDANTSEVLHFARGAWLFINQTLAEHDPLIWEDALFLFAMRFPTPPNVEEGEDTSEGFPPNNWNLYAEEANLHGKPDFTIAHGFSVEAGRTILVEAWSLFDSQSWAEGALGPLPPAIRAQIEALLPHLIYREGEGEQIVVPPASVEPTSEESGRRRMHHPVHGSYLALN